MANGTSHTKIQGDAYSNSNLNFNNELEMVQEEKDLGVLITTDLKASSQYV